MLRRLILPGLVTAVLLVAACDPIAAIGTMKAASDCKPSAERTLKKLNEAASALDRSFPAEYQDAIRAVSWTECMKDHGMDCPGESTLATAANGDKLVAAPACGDRAEGGGGGVSTDNPWKYPQHLEPIG